MTGWRALIRARLALRIYLMGLAQFAAVAVGFSVLMMLSRPPGEGPVDAHLRYIIQHLEIALATPGALEAEIARVDRRLCSTLSVFDPEGQLVASSSTVPARCDPRGPVHSNSGSFCHQRPIVFSENHVGRVECIFPDPPPFVGWHVVLTVLGVVGVSSWLLARTLTVPLRRLSRTAESFGAGSLGARVGLERSDELGEVGHAFDEMANRVEELLRAEKELLANISHELRTPLARIRVALDLATEGDADMARESLVDIAGDLDELERLITDVLTAARLDLGDGISASGLPPLRHTPIDLGSLLDQSATRFCTSHPTRPLLREIHENLGSFDGDKVLLRRAIDNLLENAHRYSDRPDAEVSLLAYPSQSGVTIEVVDQGVGIAPDDLPRVFRPFFRADRSRARATGGLGLGLALTRRIVHAHRGTIELESTVHRGTRARLWLPVKPVQT